MATDQKVAVITGAANGIGLATAKAFAAAGYAVALADIDADAARNQAAAIGDAHRGYGFDVSDQAAVRGAFEAMERDFGRLDVLVNNAGIVGSQEPSIEQDMEYFDRITKVIINGTFLCSCAAYPVMSRQGHGAIINIGSIAGLVGLPRRNAYGAAKAGVHSLTRAMACEWAGAGIRINAIAPGYIRTALVEKLIADGRVDVERLNRRVPMGRIGTPEDIADVIVFLASEQARYITGAVISVDGGWAAFGDAGNASAG